MIEARFSVDTRLTRLLGEAYRSSEVALKELVDNAWDADAENVWITLPGPMTSDPVVVADDGAGMTTLELSEEYLKVARDKRTRTGERTPRLNRKVKGRKGIGKFAGLTVASQMTIETNARGITSTVVIDKDLLTSLEQDLENVPLQIRQDATEGARVGTTITLSMLDTRLNFPTADRLKEVLIYEYGREDRFRVHVNGIPLSVEDVPGITSSYSSKLDGEGSIDLKFTVSGGKRAPRAPGIILKVNGKSVGKPQLFGLEDDDEIPKNLIKRVYGEVDLSGVEDFVTADWGGVVENSRTYQEAQEYIRSHVKRMLNEEHARDMSLQKARLQRQINLRLAGLPENRRVFAEAALNRILRKFYGETDDRISTIADVALDAMVHDAYWFVLDKIQAASAGSVGDFAASLEQFGLLELSTIGSQAKSRRTFLDFLDDLAANSQTLEMNMHQALEKNLWVLGRGYALMSSNVTLKSVIATYCDKKFVGARASKRPDLLLSQDHSDRYLLIEFKRPSHPISRTDLSQAEQYRDDLTRQLGSHVTMEIMMIGNGRASALDTSSMAPGITVHAYSRVVATARADIDWLIRSLNQD